MAPHFGARVVGRDAYDKAVREQKGGANVFGKRVRDTITEAGPVGEKKRATEHGALVVDGAKGDEGLSVEQLKKILDTATGNPTFFDSLYEAELARAEGARPDALEVFLQTEQGIKGQGRKEIIDEIRTLLGEKSVTAAQIADQNKLRLQQRDAIAHRTEENKKLQDVDRVRSLVQREEDLKLIEDHPDLARGPVALDQASERAAMTEEEEPDEEEGEEKPKPRRKR